ncbi:hypothetical protein Rumeso_04137 [Rubellimicrobium mesophilum DSM 19309]|uniref:Uncharacterized protein n=1 Tax=Rubellimicrobium mesophilum DSM 19309 TaxID=442562 RepID=A0A017HJD3_9RHOB|nr:hypothetical protein [Rubellimicrobium mesophilum]EYD74273.1 hypothetical protein Rumeso_04137 [Rubellimicrobium mesophilum DSM 19309]
MLALAFKPLAMLLPGGPSLPGSPSPRPARPTFPEPGIVAEPYQLELIRFYASAGVTAVVTINSGALIAGLSQAANLDVVPGAALACALFIWALGVTTGVATWGAAYHAVVAHASSDHEGDMRWRRIATGLFHAALSMFLLGFVAIALSLFR